MKTSLKEIEDRIKVLKEYRLVMLQQDDDHGVRDACVDIEKLKAVLEFLNSNR